MRRAAIGLFSISIAACAGRATPPTVAQPATSACDRATLPAVPHRDVIEARVATKRSTMGRAEHRMVASSHALATEVGLAVLERGGNAVDAFVAAVLTQDMVLPGVTSTAGIAGFLVGEPGKTPVYVHGAYRKPPRPEAAWQPGAAVGKTVLLPGAPFALLEAQARYGKLPLGKVLEPVIARARDGFPVDALMARAIAGRAALKASPYASATYFREGKPLVAGDLLRLPVLAETLGRVAQHGAAEFSMGAWAQAFVAEVNARGGALRLDDLRDLHASISPAIHGTYRGRELYVSGDTSFGGRKLLASLKVLEHADLARLGPLEKSAETLGLFVRTHRAVEAEPFVYDRALAGEAFDRTLNERGEALWQAVQSKRTPATAQIEGGHHSSAVIVVDDEGRVVVGTHTIETLNWGEALFVGGIPLGTAGATAPGARSSDTGPLPDPLSATMVYEAARPRLALTVYGTGLHPADLVVLTGVLDLGRDVEAAVLAPRLGWFGFDITTMTIKKDRNLLDPRVGPELRCRLGALGDSLKQEAEPGYPPGRLDLGFPTVVELSEKDGRRTIIGMTPEWMDGLAAGR